MAVDLLLRVDVLRFTVDGSEILSCALLPAFVRADEETGMAILEAMPSVRADVFDPSGIKTCLAFRIRLSSRGAAARVSCGYVKAGFLERRTKDGEWISQGVRWSSLTLKEYHTKKKSMPFTADRS